jgi:hypothetical protein
MAYINKLNTFDQVAEWYAKIKPVVSKNHTREQDVRPIGKRGRKWERIIKINDNCYAFSCGGSYDPVFSWGDKSLLDEFPLTPEDIANLAPIVWRKLADGTETITVRNGSGEWQHNATYSFLRRALPTELWFRNGRAGKQFIYVRPTGTTVHLPKTRTVPRHTYAYFLKHEAKGTTYGGRWVAQTTDKPDGLSVVFKREQNGGFTLISEKHPVMVDRMRVQKDTKAAFKPYIEAVRTTVESLYPLMQSQLNWSLRNECAKELLEIAKKHSLDYHRSYTNKGLFEHAGAELQQDIFKNPEHPMRHHLHIDAMFALRSAAYDFDNYNDDKDDPEARAKERAKVMRAAFNAWVNKAGGFTTKVREEK